MANYMKAYGDIAETLLDYVERETTDQAPEVMTVPVTAYTDPERWQREMETIYHRLPVLAALTVELPKPGDYKAMDYLGRPVLLTRQKDGAVRAMLNVCSHRAMVVAPEGKGNAARFVCPYHGWTFTNDGRLFGIADRGKFGDVDRSCLGLKLLPSYERAGLIFIVLTPDIPVDFEAFFDGALDDLEHVKIADAHFVGTRQIVGANWKVAYDGYLEGYHFAVAHPETIHPRTFSNVMKFDAFGAHLRIGFPQQSIVRQLKAAPRETWGARENLGYDFVRTLFPNVSVFAAPEIVQVSQIMPGPKPNENHTIMYFVSRVPPQNQEETDKLENMVNFLKVTVEKEDFGVGLKVQRGLESGAFDNVTFGKNERGNQYFHRYVQYLVDGSVGQPPKL